MKKLSKFLFFLGLLVVIFLIFHLRSPQEKLDFTNGVNLDIARKFYGPQAIKKLIDLVEENGGSYIQLHLSDDENVAIELETLGQTVDHAYEEKGIHYNSQTKRPFLTKTELADLVAYANNADSDWDVEANSYRVKNRTTS